MTAPLQATTTDSGRYYQNPNSPGRRFVSVTTVLGTLNKGDAITQWAANLAADKALELYQGGYGMDARPFRDASRYAWRDYRDEAGRKGDLVHDWAETFLTTGEQREVPKEIRGHIKHFLEWYASHTVEDVLCEATIYSEKHGYAGSCDLFARVDGRMLVVDFKTSKRISETTAMQAAAYRFGDYIVTADGDTLPIPQVEAGAVLHIRPRGHKFIGLNVGSDTFDAFLALLRVRRDWVEDLNDRVLLDHIPAQGVPA